MNDYHKVLALAFAWGLFMLLAGIYDIEKIWQVIGGLVAFSALVYLGFIGKDKGDDDDK